MGDAPERIWAFYTPDDFDDAATITAYETVQHGGKEYVRADLHRSLALDVVTAGGQASDAYAAQLAAEAKLAVLVKAASVLKADMLERAQIRVDVIMGEEYRVVNAGNGAWNGFCAALAAMEGATP